MTPVVITLTDFGSARHEPTLPRRMNTLCGTYDYIAPEMAKMVFTDKRGLNKGYGKEIDIWAVGIIAYAIMSGELPFSDITAEPDLGILKRIVEHGVFFGAIWATKSDNGICPFENTNFSKRFCPEVIAEKCFQAARCI
jgi:serine/threonine protein kinase